MEIEKARHSLSHILAYAVQELYPGAKFGIGPAIENGFYYDLDLPKKITPEDLPAIEAEMRALAEKNISFRKKLLTYKAAVRFFKKQPFKLELIEEHYGKNKKKAKVMVYESGRFTDLCKGPHVKSTKLINLKAFELTSVAGAYWRGDEKKKMLTRIYGVAFDTENELTGYLALIEESQKRDHKKLGKELDLFTFSDSVGAGLPLWTPRGTMLRNLLDDFVWEMRREKGYVKVEIPHITKKDLYVKSGHWDKFKDELFKIETREDHLFAMKPMNCPHHTQIYARKLHSYRELPQRYANTTMVYRDEQTGELSGLSRVRCITQDDAHVFCRKGQTKAEILAIWDIVTRFYKAAGFNLSVRLSLHDPKHPEKYLGDKKTWKSSEDELRQIIKERGLKAVEAPGEAAFYGPKIDFMAKDSLGREWQVATIQLDMNMPERFDLVCINEKGEQERVVMIHAAIMGSIERYLAILIEHLAGDFPVWMAPEQVWIIPISEKFSDYARKLKDALIFKSGLPLRISLKLEGETLGKRIREGELQKIPYLCVVGEKELQNQSVNVRGRKGAKLGELKISDFAKRLNEEVNNKIH